MSDAAAIERRIRIDEAIRYKRLRRIEKQPDNKQQFQDHVLRNLAIVSADRPNFPNHCSRFGLSVSEGKRIYYDVIQKIMDASARQAQQAQQERIKEDASNV